MGSPQGLTGISWEDKAWLLHFPFNRDTVLDYFSNSPFYDRTCNNEQVRHAQPCLAGSCRRRRAPAAAGHTPRDDGDARPYGLHAPARQCYG